MTTLEQNSTSHEEISRNAIEKAENQMKLIQEIHDELSNPEGTVDNFTNDFKTSFNGQPLLSNDSEEVESNQTIPSSNKLQATEFEDAESVVNDVMDIVYTTISHDLIECCCVAINAGNQKCPIPSHSFNSNVSNNHEVMPLSQSPRVSVPRTTNETSNFDMGGSAPKNVHQPRRLSVTTQIRAQPSPPPNLPDAMALNSLASAVSALQQEIAGMGNSGHNDSTLKASETSSIGSGGSQSILYGPTKSRQAPSGTCLTCGETRKAIGELTQAMVSMRWELEDLKLNQNRMLDQLQTPSLRQNCSSPVSNLQHRRFSRSPPKKVQEAPAIHHAPAPQQSATLGQVPTREDEVLRRSQALLDKVRESNRKFKLAQTPESTETNENFTRCASNNSNAVAIATTAKQIIHETLRQPQSMNVPSGQTYVASASMKIDGGQTTSRPTNGGFSGGVTSAELWTNNLRPKTVSSPSKSISFAERSPQDARTNEPSIPPSDARPKSPGILKNSSVNYENIHQKPPRPPTSSPLQHLTPSNTQPNAVYHSNDVFSKSMPPISSGNFGLSRTEPASYHHSRSNDEVDLILQKYLSGDIHGTLHGERPTSSGL